MSTTTLVYRSLAGARSAFDNEDADMARQLSRVAHSLPNAPSKGPGAPTAEAGHNEAAAFTGMHLLLRSALDGILIGSFIVSFADAAGWHAKFDPLFAASFVGCWALFLASRELLDVSTYMQHYSRERRREKWELDNYPEGEVLEMVQLYVRKGLKEEKARAAVEAMATESEFFVDVMMLEELQMMPPPELSGMESALRAGTGCCLCGSAIPLTYGALLRGFSPDSSFTIAMLLAAVSLAYLGSRRAMITHMAKLQLAAQTVALLLPCLLFSRVAGAHAAAF